MISIMTGDITSVLWYNIKICRTRADLLKNGYGGKIFMLKTERTCVMNFENAIRGAKSDEQLGKIRQLL